MDIFAMKSDWMWIKSWNMQDKEEPGIVYFRKECELATVPANYEVKISAASRYKLYINGSFVQEGPQKGDQEDWYMDPAEISAYLRPGKNVMAVEVLRYPENNALRNDSIVHTECPGFYILDENEGQFFNAKEGWMCKKAEHIQVVGENFRPAPIHMAEAACGSESLQGWKLAGYTAEDWEEAEIYGFVEATKACSPFNLKDRTIPAMEHKDARFRNTVCIRKDSTKDKGLTEKWNQLLESDTAVTLPAHASLELDFTTGEEMCGYPLLSLIGGTDAKIRLLWAECYVKSAGEAASTDGEAPVFAEKGDRTDFVNGVLEGIEDQYTVGGFGNEDAAEEYEPYWFRTFRFIRISVETKDEPLTITKFTYKTTGYPLEVKTQVTASDDSFAGIWDISERTLRRCMHETYIDCPFYEQLQYTMDSRAEILFTYRTAADDRLARQCMESFRCSAQHEGVLKASAPSMGVNIIPGFSIYYILMVHDHMMYFGDQALVKHHAGCIDRILEYFGTHLSENGLVASVGGILFQHKYWSFIDWTAEWNATIGVPSAINQGSGSLTMESLLYLYGLQKAAELMHYIGRDGLAEEYHKKAETLKQAVRKYCVGKNGLVQDGPGVEEYSTHCQVFAVLTDVVDAAEGKTMLEKTVLKEGYAQCSVSMSFYLFRALEKVDLYEKTNELWNLWRKMLKDNLTTCVENSTDGRSDCHAWGSLILYEMPAVYLGVRPTAPGFAEMEVRPIPGHLTCASGDVVTPKGMVHVDWTKKESGELEVSYEVL